MSKIRLRLAALSVAIFCTVSACDHRTAPTPAQLPSVPFLVLTNNNQLVSYNVNALSMPGATVAITGLQANEQVQDIDFRPANNQLYAATNLGRLYIINPTTGVATLQGSGPFTAALASGVTIAIDFNPVVDRLRLVTSDRQNLRLNVDTGVLAIDTPINGVVGASITDVAYTNNVPTATTTVMYDIDVTTSRFYIQAPPNNGTLTMPFNDGLTFTATNGFDVSPAGQTLAGLTIGGTVELLSVTLATGRTQKLGVLPANTLSLAIPTN